MLIAAGRSFFTALLKLESGEIIANGNATVNIPGRCVTFKSDFVPLYPMGTPMEVVRTHHSREIHRFTGTVYLSDKNLMRIVSVNDELLPGSELFYCDNMKFPAVATPCSQPSKSTAVFPLLRSKAPEAPTALNVVLTEISDQQLAFQCETQAPLAVGTQLHIDAAAPVPLVGQIITIQRQFLFGQPVSYICSYDMLTAIQRQELQNFLWEYNLSTNKLF